jgi:hypothetical protein
VSAVCPNGHTSEADDYCDTCGSPIDASAQPPVGAGAVPASGAAGPAGGTAGGTASGAVGAAPASTGSSLDLDAPGPPGGQGSPGPGDEGTPAPAAPSALECPNCKTENPDGALFCEACGYDFTTGAMPRDAAGVGAGAPAGAAGAAGAAGTPVSEGNGSGGATFEWLAEVWVDPDWYQTQEAEDPCPSPGLPTIMPLRRRSVLLGRVSTSKNTHPEIDLSSDPGVSRRHAQLTTDGTRWFVEDLGSSNGTFVGPASGPLPERPIAVGPKTELDDDDRLYVGAWTRVVVRRATPDEVDAYA